MMRLRLIAVLAIVSGFAWPANAQFVDGVRLMDFCGTRSDLLNAVCENYIAGVVDTIGQNQLIFKGTKVCFSTKITKLDAKLIVIRWMERNSQNKYEPAPQIIAAALREAYPCR